MTLVMGNCHIAQWQNLRNIRPLFQYVTWMIQCIPCDMFCSWITYATRCVVVVLACVACMLLVSIQGQLAPNVSLLDQTILAQETHRCKLGGCKTHGAYLRKPNPISTTCYFWRGWGFMHHINRTMSWTFVTFVRWQDVTKYGNIVICILWMQSHPCDKFFFGSWITYATGWFVVVVVACATSRALVPTQGRMASSLYVGPNHDSCHSKPFPRYK
jgi:hypothetical protein